MNHKTLLVSLSIFLLATQSYTWAKAPWQDRLNIPSIPSDFQVSRTRTLDPQNSPPIPSPPPPPPADPAKTRWAVWNLDRLIRQYRCIPNYSKKPALSFSNPNRYVMAAALDACVYQLEGKSVDARDRMLLKALNLELGPELEILKYNVNSLE